MANEQFNWVAGIPLDSFYNYTTKINPKKGTINQETLSEVRKYFAKTRVVKQAGKLTVIDSPDQLSVGTRLVRLHLGENCLYKSIVEITDLSFDNGKPGVCVSTLWPTYYEHWTQVVTIKKIFAENANVLFLQYEGDLPQLAPHEKLHPMERAKHRAAYLVTLAEALAVTKDPSLVGSDYTSQELFEMGEEIFRQNHDPQQCSLIVDTLFAALENRKANVYQILNPDKGVDLIEPLFASIQTEILLAVQDNTDLVEILFSPEYVYWQDRLMLILEWDHADMTEGKPYRIEILEHLAQSNDEELAAAAQDSLDHIAQDEAKPLAIPA